MTPQEFAEKIDCNEYPFGLSPQESKIAQEHGLVVIYGASDDLMEVEGAIQDEGDCYDGGTLLIDKQGLLEPFDSFRESNRNKLSYQAYFKREENAKQIEAIWCKDDISWQYKTDIPHATFKIMEDGEVYCIGMVFDIKELRSV